MPAQRAGFPGHLWNRRTSTSAAHAHSAPGFLSKAAFPGNDVIDIVLFRYGGGVWALGPAPSSASTINPGRTFIGSVANHVFRSTQMSGFSGTGDL